MRSVFALSAIVLALAVAGCGGGGGGSSTLPVPSPFVGTYVGTFNGNSIQPTFGTGSLNLSVTNGGTLTGNSTASGNPLGQHLTLSGAIANTGTANLTFTSSTGFISTNGGLAFATNGHLDGTLYVDTGGSVITVDLVKQ